jgi:hypothetical protein
MDLIMFSQVHMQGSGATLLSTDNDEIQRSGASLLFRAHWRDLPLVLIPVSILAQLDVKAILGTQH